MIILALESSCDDTSVALLDITDERIVILAESTASQIDIHKKYGGVVPEIAGRKHAEKIIPLVEAVLENQPKPEAIAVTSGPGLVTGLLVGTEVAKTLSYLWNIPLIATNHIEGHIHSVLISEQRTVNSDQSPLLTKPARRSGGEGLGEVHFPAVCLVVSGGHTELILMKDHGEYELIGKTRDDAAGECFDKVAKILGFAYPGGPKISEHAREGNTAAIQFPRPMIDSDNYDFSFAGLKTAALYWLRDNQLQSPLLMKPTRQLEGEAQEEVHPVSPPHMWGGQGGSTINDFSASFEQAIVDVLTTKTMKAVKQYQPNTVIVAGGVSANKKLRDTLEALLKEYNPEIHYRLCPREYSMDNAAMIGIAGYFKAKKKQFTTWNELLVDPNWKVYQQ